ncbi:MAG: hypothetical protein Q8M53_14435 [Burkholderiales bacterium]|nr:hypothetical protein [Burkholderiales bacterium]
MIGTVRFRQNAYFTISHFARQPWLRLRGREPLTDSVRLQKKSSHAGLVALCPPTGQHCARPTLFKPNPERIAQNLDVFNFTLTAEENKRI